MNNLSMISRDWRRGLIEFASIGYDYSPPNPATRWIVITGRTASGKAMERTDEPMIVTSERHFASDHEASAWQAAWIAGPIGNCKCGKPISHLDANEDSTEWACRVPQNRTCECYHDCGDCSLSGDWHVHPGELCPVHPDAPGDHAVSS